MLRAYVTSARDASGNFIQTRNTALGGAHRRVIDTLLEIDENASDAEWQQWLDLRDNWDRGNGFALGLYAENGDRWDHAGDQ